MCSLIGLNQFLFVDDDGSLIKVPFKGKAEPVKIFDSIPGFEMSHNLEERLKQCAFLNGVNVIKDPEGKGYLIRIPETREEHLLPKEFLFVHIKKEDGSVSTLSRPFDSLKDIRKYIKYPFAIVDGYSWPVITHRVLHIPSGKSQEIKDRRILEISSEGRMSFEVLETYGKKAFSIGC